MTENLESGGFPEKAWSHLFLRDRDTGRPCWGRPSTAWRYRYFATPPPDRPGNPHPHAADR